jgi:uncharacterized cofD-like protein
MLDNTYNITVIWGGSGTFNVLYGLKTYHLDTDEEKKNLAAIIAMTDSGGTTGKIRDKYWVLPPGDIRRGIAALARDTGLVRQLFEYKFKDETGVIGSNKIGNTLLTALADITWSFEAGLDAACSMFDVQGKVIPVTLEDVHLGVEMQDGTTVIGEKNIDVSDTNPGEKTHNADQNIAKAFLVWGEGNLNPRAKEAIMDSDIIVLGPGDFYTSIIPNLLSKWMKEVLAKTEAKIVYVCNIMADKGETTTYELPDFIDNIEKYAGNVVDYVLVNSWDISQDLVDSYKNEGKKPVKLKDGMEFASRRFKVIERDFINESDVIRHDPQKLAKVIMDVCRGWIK